MTREEAIKWLIRPVVSGTVLSDTKRKELEAYDMAIEALEKPKTGWIPVSERLPEEHVKVLMFGHEALNDKDVYAVKQLDVDVFRPVSAPSVRWLAWMPLPEPYKGGEEE